MSTDEMRRQKGELAVEFQELQQECSHLKEKLRRIGDRFSDFGQKLSSNPALSVYRQPYSSHGFATQPLPEGYESKLDFASAMAVADEYREKMAKLNQLEVRAREIGAPINREIALRSPETMKAS